MILIAIGGNLPNAEGQPPREICVAAAAAMTALPGLVSEAVSSWYRTKAVASGVQPDYCNGVIRLAGNIEPLTLLESLQAIEMRFGRVRGEHNAPRTLDLDIIDLNGIIRAVPDPILPHPRAHLRGFVLRPILDVAPGWEHPVFRRSVTSLMVDLPHQSISPWPEAD